MAKRLSEIQKKEISKGFLEGETINELVAKFNCTKATISRNLKKSLGEKKYEELTLEFTNKKTPNPKSIKEKSKEKSLDDNSFTNSTFYEIPPLDYEIDNLPQKDLSSVPLSEIELPKLVYMIVNKEIELEVKLLNNYPNWQFLSQNELNRKVIEIYLDLKIAKKSCTKERKVIKVPNSNVFKIVAPILLSKGISRIVAADNLISL